MTYIPAVVFFLIHDENVLLIRRKKASNNLGHNLISGVGGKVGDDKAFAHETIEEALVRESQEEIEVTPTKFMDMGIVRFLWETKPSANMETHIFTVTEWVGRPTETDVAAPQWYPINELPVNEMWEDNQHWVPRILAGETVNMTFFYDSDGVLSAS